VPLTAASLRALAERPAEPLTQHGLAGLVWPADDRRVLRYRAAALAADPSSWPWLLHAAVDADGRLVGRIGCHEAPVAGQVEVGYAVVAGERRRGVATRLLEAFLDWLRGQGVTSVVLSVAPGNEASLRLARRAGFRVVGEREDEEDGRELVLALVLPPGAGRRR
jgi:RimJ/RimL family protein N-acetyltransferase